MPVFRTYYPLQYIAIGPYGAGASSGYTPIHGLQSVGLTTTFNLENVFELGQLNIYQTIEQLPNIEMTLEKVLDGYPLIYHLATQQTAGSSLYQRSQVRCDAVLSIFSDAQDQSSGTPLTQCYCSGLFTNNINYTLPVNGNARESVTLVGNDKLWVNSGFYFNGAFTTNTDAPLSGVQRRQNVIMGSAGAGGSVWPSNIPGMTVTNGSGFNVQDAAGNFGAHIQDVTIATNLGREDLFELGRLKSYYRFARFPTAVNTTINILSGGSLVGDQINASSNAGDITTQPIIVKLQDGTVFDLGSSNRITNVSWTGGDVSGAPVTISYAFQNFNIMKVTQPQDPAHQV